MCVLRDNRMIQVCEQVAVGEPYGPGQCRLAWLWHHDAAYRTLWGGDLLARARTLPCVHRGEEVARVPCATCTGKVEIKVLRCATHTTCSVGREIPGIRCCASCADYEPDTYRLVAPGGCRDRAMPFYGRAALHPASYAVTLAIPHLTLEVADLEPLRVALDLWRLQTARPFLLLVDTGSPPAVIAALRSWEDDDLELMELRGRGYLHSSEPVSVAMDCAFARCPTDYLFATHQDVFPVRRDLLAWYLSQGSADRPVVGYQMSPRNGTDLWRICPSHTATLFHVPWCRRHGVNWNVQDAVRELGLEGKRTVGWPDTETNLGLTLRRAGVTPYFIGTETNYQLHEDANLVHVRSLPGTAIYGGDPAYYQKARGWMVTKLAEARLRLARWRAGKE